jgi:methanogenic corrinoid protein MtbC1
VPPAEFVRAAAEFKPDLVAVSALITDSFPNLRELVQLFENTPGKRPKRPIIMIGGGQVDEVVHRVSGSDCWTQDAFAGVKLCERLMMEATRVKD